MKNVNYDPREDLRGRTASNSVSSSVKRADEKLTRGMKRRTDKSDRATVENVLDRRTLTVGISAISLLPATFASLSGLACQLGHYLVHILHSDSTQNAQARDLPRNIWLYIDWEGGKCLPRSR